jgi:hypothetical protein
MSSCADSWRRLILGALVLPGRIVDLGLHYQTPAVAFHVDVEPHAATSQFRRHGYISGVRLGSYGAGLKKDMQDLTNDLRQDLSRDILRPAGWEDLYPSEGCLYSSSLGDIAFVPKWGVVEDDVIAIEIFAAAPVRAADEPFVNLYVPENWEMRQQFITKLKAPPGFEHVSQHPEDELVDTTSVFKFIRYESYVGPDSRFDATGFIEAFREATKALVALEKDIDQILESLG